MKLLIASDSHNVNKFDEMIKLHNPDLKIHAGDSQYLELDRAEKDFDYIVKGNCDYIRLSETITFTVEGLKVGLTHGHLFDIKFYDNEILERFSDCDVIIHGHSHVVRTDHKKDKLILNPGSTVLSRGQYPGSYMIVDIEGRNLSVKLYNYKDNEMMFTKEFSL